MTNPQTLTTIRRKDRRITNTVELHALLAHADIGYLATVAEKQPYVTPYTFWFDGHHIYFHGAKKGRVKENMVQNPRVCFTVAERGRYLPDKHAMNFSVEYASVMVFGAVRTVETDAEKIYALNGMLEKYFPHLKAGTDYRAIVQTELLPTAVFAINIDAMSGKRKAAPDHPTTGKLRAFFSLDEVTE